MSTQNYDRQNPAFYVLLIVLVLMAVGPIYLMLVTSLKLNVDIVSRREQICIEFQFNGVSYGAIFLSPDSRDFPGGNGARLTGRELHGHFTDMAV